MSEHPKHRVPFIPAWLDDAGLSAATFRVYCHLARSADNFTGIAWPSYERMTAICGLGKSTVRRCLEELEGRKMIAKAGKPFGGSCRYRVLPIVPPQGQMQDSNSSTTDPIEAAPIVPPQNCNSPSDGTSIVPPQGHEGSPKKVLQLRESKDIPQIESSELVLDATPGVDKAASAEAIYQAYPRKVSKKDGIAEILKAMKRHPAAVLLERTQTYANSIRWQETRFIPHPATWFKGERFNDDPKEWEKPVEPATRNAKTPISMDEVIQSLGRRHPEWGQDHRQAKKDREYPEPPITKLPKL